VSKKTKFAVTAVVIALAVTAGFAAYKARSLSAELNDLRSTVVPKAARLDTHCSFMRV
jgi:hypothetical protein